MFYYGLDFYDLAPNFILKISAFNVMCEAFLRIRPHFGLWLKTFNIKPKVVGGQQAECGGAMVGKMPNVTWLEGAFMETIKGWQSGWFYMTEPRDPEWAAGPEFYPQHLGVYRRVRGLPLHPAPLRLVAQDLQCQAEGCEGQPSGVRRRHGGQDVPRYVAGGHLCGNHQGMAIGVILHHRAARP